jgi:hypothetical protein
MWTFRLSEKLKILKLVKERIEFSLTHTHTSTFPYASKVVHVPLFSNETEKHNIK